MRKGISPIVAVVLLIAVAIIAAVGLYFWVGGIATKQHTPNVPVAITATPIGGGKVLIANLGSTAITGGLEATEGTLSCSYPIPPGQQGSCNLSGASDESVTIYGSGTGSAVIQTITVGGCNPICEIGEGCASSEDCETRFCDGGVCAACSVPANCQPGYICVSGTCTPCTPNCGIGSPCSAPGDCASGNCTDGVCKGTQTLASGLNNPRSIALASSDVIWTHETAAAPANITLQQKPKAGGTAITLYTNGHSYGVATDGSYVYWTEYNEGTVRKIPVGNGTITTLASGLGTGPGGGPYDIAVDSTTVFWTAYDGTLRNVSKTGSCIGAGCTTLVSSLGISAVIDLDSDYVYIGQWGAGNISRILKNGTGGRSVLKTGMGIVGDIVVNSGSIYFTDYSNPGNVSKMAVTGGAVTPLATGLNKPWGIATDGTDVYIAEQTGGNVKKVPVGGGSVTTVVSGLNRPTMIAVDDVAVYWTEYNAAPNGAVKAAAK